MSSSGADRFEHHELGFSWLADPGEKMERACHALEVDGRVWVIDPVDVEGLDQALAELGEPVAVVQLLDRHARDCEELATRLGVPCIDRPLEDPAELSGSPFEVVKIFDMRAWKEAALWWPERRALVVPESLGTAAYFRAGSELVGVHPMIRFGPPRKQLSDFRPEHLLTGHGTGAHGDEVAAAMADSLSAARRRLPKALLSMFRSG